MKKSRFLLILLAIAVAIFTITWSTPSYADEEGSSDGCKPLAQRYAEIQVCPLCPLFSVILKTDQTMATQSFDALAPGFLNVIIVVMALYVAYQTLITVSSWTKQDAPKYIMSLLNQGLKVLIAAVLLSDSTHIYKYVVNPLMSAGLEFGISLLFDAEILSEFKSLSQSEQGSIPSGVIGKDLLGSVMAAIRMFTEAAAQLPAIGSALICISIEHASFLIDFSMFIQGVVVWALGWLIAIACCFYLLDAVVRFGIFCTLLPFFIASWPFKVTASYTKTGWDIFMNTFFNFVMMGLIITVSSELVAQALSGGTGDKGALEAAINNNNVEHLKEIMSFDGVNFLVLIACCMFAFKLVGQVNELASQISNTSGGTSIGGKLGGAAAQMAKKAAGTVGKGAKAAAGAVYEGTGLKGSVERGKDKAMAGLAKVGAKMGLRENKNG